MKSRFHSGSESEDEGEGASAPSAGGGGKLLGDCGRLSAVNSSYMSGGSWMWKYVISPARPVAVALYMPQQVFMSSSANFMSSSCSGPQRICFLACSSGKPPVVARARVPGMKQTRWSIFGLRLPPRPEGLSAKTVKLEGEE
jgi:hypothetical protein